MLALEVFIISVAIAEVLFVVGAVVAYLLNR